MVTNSIPLEIRCSLKEEVITATTIRSELIPWLHVDRVSVVPILADVQNSINDSIGRYRSNPQLQFHELWENLVSRLKWSFLHKLALDVDLEPAFIFEEHSPNAGKILLDGIGRTSDEITAFSSNRNFSWVPFEEVLEANALSITPDQIRVEGTLAPSPGESIGLEVSSDLSFLLAGVRIEFEDQILAKKAFSQVLGETSTWVEFPDIPVHRFSELAESQGKVFIVLEAGDSRKELRFPYLAQIPQFQDAPWAIFLDLGSCNTKRMGIKLIDCGPNDQRSREGWGHVMIEHINKAVIESIHSDDVWKTIPFADPEPTAQFLESRSIPQLEKEELAKDEDASVAWFSSAVRGLARHAAAVHSRSLSHIVFSFPSVSSIEFERLNQRVRDECETSVLGRILIIPEHQSLHARFHNTFAELAAAARLGIRVRTQAENQNRAQAESYKQESADFKRRKSEYDNCFFLFRWLSSEPTAPTKKRDIPVPPLEWWFYEYLDFDPDKDSHDFLALDAGGYSLDVVASIGDEVYGKSFEAGGESVTDGILKELRLREGPSLRRTDATKWKHDLCDGENALELNDADILRNVTKEIYHTALSNIGGWLENDCNISKLPVILTGGGMANPCLRELIKDEFKSTRVRFLEATTITHLVENSDQFTDRLSVQRFARISRAFTNRNRPRLHFDIVGGSIEQTLGFI